MPADTLDKILTELKEKQINAANRGKPTMWGYYLAMRRALIRWFGSTRKPGKVAGYALGLIHAADCHKNDRCAQRAAFWAAQAVYARRILGAWTKIDGPLQANNDWLRARANED